MAWYPFLKIKMTLAGHSMNSSINAHRIIKAITHTAHTGSAYLLPHRAHRHGCATFLLFAQAPYLRYLISALDWSLSDFIVKKLQKNTPLSSARIMTYKASSEISNFAKLSSDKYLAWLMLIPLRDNIFGWKKEWTRFFGQWITWSTLARHFGLGKLKNLSNQNQIWCRKLLDT